MWLRVGRQFMEVILFFSQNQPKSASHAHSSFGRVRWYDSLLGISSVKCMTVQMVVVATAACSVDKQQHKHDEHQQPPHQLLLCVPGTIQPGRPPASLADTLRTRRLQSLSRHVACLSRHMPRVQTAGDWTSSEPGADGRPRSDSRARA